VWYALLMPAVHVYTRHRKTCSRKSDRAWKSCPCPKWLLWHYHGKMFRQSASTRDWNVAAKMARNVEQDYERHQTREPKAALDNGPTLEGAVNLYLVDRESQHLRPATLSKLETIFSKQMLAWFHDLGVRFLRDVTLPHLQAWRGSWADGPLAAKKKQERVKGFFWFCFRNKWITDNPSLGLSPIKADVRPAEGFTPEEWSKIVQATHRYGRTETERSRIRALVCLLRWSGLAIRDAVTLERQRLGADDRLILRRAKTGVAVMLPLQPNVAAMLRSVPAGPKPNPRYFFWSGHGLPKSAVADWQRALRRLFKIADLRHADGEPKRCHAHMFRHTFSIEMLLSGVPIEDVARLLGHASIKTTEKYYSAWVQARSERLEESVRSAWH